MYYNRESQFTNNASKRVFEEVYINEDLLDSKANPSNGCYTLSVPQQFASNLSQEKAISPRRVMCEPNSHMFNARVTYYNPNTLAVLGTTPYISFDFTSNNTMEEFLNHMYNSFQLNTYSVCYKYDKITGMLTLIAVDSATGSIMFRFECNNYNNYNELWRLFNQLGNPFFSVQDDYDLYNDDTLSPTAMIQMPNVWNREPLYVHATFSSSKKHYLCRSGDFWFKPSKYYYDNVNSNDFDIFFTTDGSHWIIPYDAVKVVELCFILRQFARL